MTNSRAATAVKPHVSAGGVPAPKQMGKNNTTTHPTAATPPSAWYVIAINGTAARRTPSATRARPAANRRFTGGNVF